MIVYCISQQDYNVILVYGGLRYKILYEKVIVHSSFYTNFKSTSGTNGFLIGVLFSKRSPPRCLGIELFRLDLHSFF